MDIPQPSSFSIDRSTLRDFDEAFNNVKPKINTQGNRVTIRQQGEINSVSLSMPTTKKGFTR